MKKNLFIVTSALKPTIGVISEDDRFKQTIDTLESIKKIVPNAYIVFTDGSPFPIEEHKIKEISKYCKYCYNGIKDFGEEDESSEPIGEKIESFLKERRSKNELIDLG